MIRRRLVSTCKHDQAQGGHCTSTCRQNQPGWGSTPCCCQEPATTHASIRVRTHTHTRGMKVWCSPPPHTPHTNTLCRGRGRLPTNCRGRSPPHCRWAGTCGTHSGRPPCWRWCPPAGWRRPGSGRWRRRPRCRPGGRGGQGCTSQRRVDPACLAVAGIHAGNAGRSTCTAGKG